MQDEYDYVIVGAGSAGCVLARRLTEDPDVSVLLLEAGGRNRSMLVDMPAAFSVAMNLRRHNWGYVAAPEPGLDNRRLDCPRGLGLGGSSAINGMVYVRGHPQDFERWHHEAGPDHDWSYAAVLPYFKRAERCLDANPDPRYRGLAGPLGTTTGTQQNPLYDRFARACEAAGYALSEDLNGWRQEAFGALPMTVERGVRASTARAYLRASEPRPGLCVVTRALVDHVDIDGGRARAVVWRDARRRRQRVAARREVLLCAGAIESPCVLQRSGVGPATLLRQHGLEVQADLPVGQNLMDHLEVYVQQACAPALSLNRQLTPARKALIGLTWLTRRTGAGATNHFEAGGFVRSAAGVAWPDVQFHFLPAAMNYDGSRVSPTAGFQLHVGPMLPASRGHVAITAPSAGRHPHVQFNYMSEQADVVTFRRCVQLARELLAQPSLAEISGAELQPGPAVRSDAAIDAWIRREAQSAYHPCGTCRMGSGENAVVDGAARVHGIDALRVVDASIFPFIPNGNLNAPTIMVAEKIAAEITGRTLAPEPQPFYEDEAWATRQR